MQTLKIGARVRCTGDNALGRITWANGVSVKIRWDDGEQITWWRDSLTNRPIEILADEETAPEPTAPAEAPPADPTTDCEDRSVMTSVEGMAVVNPEPAAELAQETEQTTTADEGAAATAEARIDAMTTLTEVPADAAPAKKARRKKVPKAEAEPKKNKLGAVDAAA